MEPLTGYGFVCFFLGGGGGGIKCRWLLQRPGVDFECSCMGWLVLGPLVSQGLRSEFFVPVCVAWLPWGIRGCGMDCFGSALGLVGVFFTHWCLSLLGCLMCFGSCW